MRNRSSDGRSKKRNGAMGPGEAALDGARDGKREEAGVDATLVAHEDRTEDVLRWRRAILVTENA